MLTGKTVVLGVTGSIAAYKSASLASSLVKLGADVHVLMTENATKFINPITFESLTKNRCIVDTFNRNFEYHIGHVSLGQKADVMLIAPATANVIAKLAAGIADDMLTTTAVSMQAPILISPAMNVHMYHNPIVQDNLEKLKKFGMKIITPATGYLACGDIGEGKMPEPEVLLEHILLTIAHDKDLNGANVLVSAGPTREPLDPVRYISNNSSGKMGVAIAKAAARRGAKVSLVLGPSSIKKPLGVETVDVTTAAQMKEEIDKRSDADIIIMAAAVADYKPKAVADNKIKKSDNDMSIALSRTDDIIAGLGAKKRKGQFICGFSMETENMLENSKAKLQKKNLDMIVANNVKVEGAGFAGDTNIVTIITKDNMIELPKLSKSEVSDRLLDEILKLK